MKSTPPVEELNIREAMSKAHPPIEGHDEGDDSNWLVSYADMMTLLVGFFVILLSFSTIDPKKFELIKQTATQEFGGQYEPPFKEMSERIRESLKTLGLDQSLSIHQTAEGVEISILGTVFFDLGSANLRPEAVEIVKKMIPIIRAEPTDFDVIVEGHTDDVPVSSNLEYASNWELSSVRACRVLSHFEGAGFPKSHLTALGYGDARPLLPNRDAAGNSIPGNQEKNRRVLIRLIRHKVSSIGGEAAS